AEEKVREIEMTLSAEESAASLDRLAYLAHQLKGSGGSYGYQRISTDAAEIEKAVEGITTDEIDSRTEEKIQLHVVNLRAEIEKRLKELA
ncbi:MAG: Hpt domain-containing protein, partial [Thermoanaerobaculia bacterium]